MIGEGAANSHLRFLMPKHNLLQGHSAAPSAIYVSGYVMAQSLRSMVNCVPSA